MHAVCTYQINYRALSEITRMILTVPSVFVTAAVLATRLVSMFRMTAELRREPVAMACRF